MNRAENEREAVRRALTTLVVVTLGAALLASPVAVLAVSSPVARWALDDGSGTTANDAIGTADGTLSGGATWLTSNAAVGTGAIALDGVNDQVTVPSSAAIQPATAQLDLWVRGAPGHPPAPGQVILEKGAFACAGPSYGLYVAAGGVRLSFRSPNGEQLSLTVTDDSAKVDLWDGAWHFITARMFIYGFYSNSTSGELIIDGFPPTTLVNGDILPVDQQHTSAIRYTGATHDELIIGGPVDQACGGTHFDGDVDDVRLYADPSFAYASLMPPITTTVTGLGTVIGHPGGNYEALIAVTPAPRWGTVASEIYKDGAWSSFGSWSPDDFSHIVLGGTAPLTPGTYPIRASFSASLPYLDSAQTGTLNVTPWPSTTTLSVSPDPKLPFSQISMHARVDSTFMPTSSFPQGNVEFWETTSGPPVLLGTSGISPSSPGDGTSGMTYGGFGAGTHKVVAKYVGPDPYRAQSTSPTVDIVVGKYTPSVSLENLTGNPVETHNAFTLGSWIGNASDVYAGGATVTFTRVGSPTPTCVVPVVLGVQATCSVPSLPIGTYQFVASYSGNANVQPATSAPITVNVVADTVHATGVGLQYTAFYPVTDAFRDTVAISGVRSEPIAVTTRIYTPGGTLINTHTFALGSGPYSWAWNGRYSTGTIRPEGNYKITQTLVDAAGTTKTFTSYVTLSKKKLYTYSKTITKSGSSVDAKGITMPGSVTLNTASGYALLKSGGSGFAGVGWEFTLPTATIYTSLKFQVYARGGISALPNLIGMQNFPVCPYTTGTTWLTNCFDFLASVGNASITTAWYTAPGSVTTNRYGTHVRGILGVQAGNVYVYSARAVVTYGVLGY